MGEQGDTDVCRISVFSDGVKKPTNTLVFTFNTPVLPSVVKIGLMQVKADVRVYIPNPLCCYQCQVFGHHENRCGRQAICVNCNMPEHCPVGQCQIPAKCVNCSGEHPANSKQCPAWEKEKKILKIKCEQNISLPEARKQYEQFYDTLSYASAVKPGTCNKSTQTDNKSTQIDDSFTEYLKQQEQSSSEKHPRKHLWGKQDNNTSSPRPGPALKPATLEMIEKEKERKKKEEKDRIKQQQKEERQQQYHKDKKIRELKEKEQAEKAHQNPYSLLH